MVGVDRPGRKASRPPQVPAGSRFQGAAECARARRGRLSSRLRRRNTDSLDPGKRSRKSHWGGLICYPCRRRPIGLNRPELGGMR